LLIDQHALLGGAEIIVSVRASLGEVGHSLAFARGTADVLHAQGSITRRIVGARLADR